MSDTLAGLTRRIHAFVHDRETSEELSHLIEEAGEQGGDACDALIELALGGDALDQEEDIIDLEEDYDLESQCLGEAMIEMEDEEVGDDLPDLGDVDFTEDDLDSELEELEDEEEEEELEEGASPVHASEVFVI